jgi:hypothetical protein
VTHIPTGSQPTPDAAQGPWGHQPAPGTPGQAAAPQPGPRQGWGAPMDPAATQAAWRYSARSKNNTVAWLLWLGGPFLIGLPIHDFYFGAVGRGLLKLGLIVFAFIALFGGMIGGVAASGSSESTAGVLIILGVVLCIGSFVAILIWWIVDGVTMTSRLERTNDRIRREIAAQQGVDPWSF